MLGAALRIGIGEVLKRIRPYRQMGEEIHQTYSEVWNALLTLENGRSS
jgi:hypothetical protein